MYKRTAGTPLSEAELRQRRAAAQSRIRRIAISRVLAFKKTGGTIVYRGAPVPDFHPEPRGHATVHVASSKDMTRDYADKGWITAYGLSPSAKFLDASRVVGDPQPTGDTRRLRIRHGLALMARIGVPKHEIRSDYREGEAEEAKQGTVGEPDVYLEAAHRRPEHTDPIFLRRQGYAGTAIAPAYSIADTSVIRALYSRHEGEGRQIALAKRDLTEAEHQQRVDAARARWAAVAVTANAAAAVGGLAAGAAHRYATRKAQAAIHEANAPSREAEAIHKARLDRIDARAKAAKVNPVNANPKFFAGSKKALGIKVRLAVKALRAVSPPLESITLGDGSIQHLTPYTPEMDQPATHLRNLRGRLYDLQMNGKLSTKVPVKAAKPNVINAHSRTVRIAAVNWSPGAAHKLHTLLQHAGLTPNQAPTGLLSPGVRRKVESYAERVAESISHPEGHDGVSFPQVRELLLDNKVKNLTDLARVVAEVDRPDRASFLAAHMLPALGKPKNTKEVAVRQHIQGRGQHLRRIEGYPKKPARKTLAALINSDIVLARDHLYTKELEAGAARQVIPDALSATRAVRPLRLLNALKTVGTLRTGAAGAVAAGLAAYFYANRLRGESNNVALGKVDEELSIEDSLNQTEGVFKAGSDVEASLAARIGRALTGLKADIGERLGQARGGSIHDTMLTDLDRAMRPIDTAMQAGAAVAPAVEAPRAYEVALTMQARSTLPEAFVQQYRLDRVRELAGDQRDAIKAVLLSAAKDGAPPAEMARRIRQTVGLTAYQAGLVLTYRRQLETGDPRALTRALRDKRYDGMATKAVAGKKLSVVQIDRMTDAYHRKFLALRANTIARTESLRAANNGHVAGVEQLLQDNPDMDVIKTWIATGDDRTRHDHKLLNGTSVQGLDTPFIADDGSEIRWPHDPDAPASQNVNCRCSLGTTLVPKTPRLRTAA